MIINEEFKEATLRFDEMEKRGSFYWMAVNLIRNGFEIEAYLLTLATWGFASFRYAVKDFDISGFRDKIRELDPHFVKMEDENFRTIDFDRYEADIKEIFETLSQIKGVQFTNTSKIMHLKNRDVFIMWDQYIAGLKPQKYYNQLDIVRSGFWRSVEYRGADGYFQFLKNMQSRFESISFQHSEKTFAKAVDEFNFVKITLPIQQMEKNERKRR